MRALWIMNKCCGALHRKRFGRNATGGQWLEAMLEQAALFPEDRITVVNIEKKPVIDHYQEGNISFYTLPGESNDKYDYLSAEVRAGWKRIFEKEQPEILVIWGTEFPYSLAAMDAAPEVPAVIYVQGILDSIAKYYLSGLTDDELRQAVSLRDVLMGTTIRQTQRRYAKRTRYEKEIFRRARGMIIENRWAEAYCRKLCPGANIHFLPLGITACFGEHRWSEDGMQPHSIMCPAAYYPIKGLHMLLKALEIVKEQYPDVRLYIPGIPFKSPRTLIEWLKQTGYARLILGMVRRMDLEKNIIFTGRLTAEEMAEKMARVNCFVMCSAIENHSSTLKEAMTVGTPCVASSVGGVPDYAVDGDNCLLYRFEDYEVLAQGICRIFTDPALRQNLSHRARGCMIRPEQEDCEYARMRRICESVMINGYGG